MNKTDKILREVGPQEIRERKPFAFFGWEGDGAFSFISISDGYWEAAKILLERMNSESNKISLLDTLIYPLFFNYRHSIETYLKALFFTYGDQADEERKTFLNLGHNLLSLWTKLKPFLTERKERAGCSVDLSVIENYIKSVNKFDRGSMMMRYPITKNLKSNKGKEYRLDFNSFGKSMNELCDSLRELDFYISNLMDEEATPEELRDYLEVFEKYKDNIDEFLLLLKEESEKESEDEIITDLFDDIESLLDEEMLGTDKYLQNSEPDLLILLKSLYYGGRLVKENSVRLSKDPISRRKEFVRLCNNLLKENRLSFGEEPNNELNIEGKMASSLLKDISESISILTLEGEIKKD
mgnify:CR=1 FL=1